MENNELSKNSKGGTELMMERLHNSIDPELMEKFQIIPSRVRELEKDKKKILWLHDLPHDPESKHLSIEIERRRFDKLVFVSHWQQHYYHLVHGVKYSESIVLPNAIEPIVFKNSDGKRDTEEIRLIYHTTPHRGLEILVPVFYEICKHIDNVTLDVYSSFSIYGWEARDRQYEEIFKMCREHPKINYHGAVPNAEVREALKKSHIFAYPNIWPETSCLAVIEAMSAKNIVVTSNLGALPETCANWANMYMFNEDIQVHAQHFANVLLATIKSVDAKNASGFLDQQKQFFDNFYNWHNRAKEWELVMKSLL